MVIIDTDVLLLAFAFHQDRRQAANTAFLQQVQAAQPATTIYNVMEILGQLSFNLASERLDAWQSWLIDAYQLVVIWPSNPDLLIESISFREEIFERPYARMRTYKMPFVDALILNLAERTPDATRLVTWNARHFQDKSTLHVLTPEEYLLQATEN
jgi:predicted nucleic acid-binding protein